MPTQPRVRINACFADGYGATASQSGAEASGEEIDSSLVFRESFLNAASALSAADRFSIVQDFARVTGRRPRV